MEEECEVSIQIYYLEVLWLYDIKDYTTSCFGAAEPSAPDQGFEIDPDVV